jgi:RNA polymerase sigma-70 factor (ECF subfamily)
MPAAPFFELIRRVRDGDAEASAELARLYEPAVRIAVRARLTNRGLRRVFDSMDICQSVMGNFFVRVALGQFELDSPDQLIKLLVTMARNRLTQRARQYQAARRDQRRTVSLGEDAFEPSDPAPSPSEVVLGKELLESFRSRLSPEERLLVEQRTAGRTWAEIASEVGSSPDALRMQLARALDMIAKDLQIGV